MPPRLAARSYPRFGRCEHLAKMRMPSYPSPDPDAPLELRLEADTNRLRAASHPRSELRGRLSTHDRSLTALVESSGLRDYGFPNKPTTLQSSLAAPGLRTHLRRPTTPRRERPGVGSGRPPARRVTPTEALAETAHAPNPVTPIPNPAVFQPGKPQRSRSPFDGIRPLRRPHGFPTSPVGE